MSITLYDIPAAVPGGVISSNTFKTRLALVYKGLSFKTEWLELPDIEPKMKELGADPTSTREDGESLYTLPVIHDHNRGRIISDSMQIAFYLDDTYPDLPLLFPHDVRAPIVMFDLFFVSTAISPGFDLINHGAFKRLSQESFEYIRRTRGVGYMAKVAELSTPGNPQGEALWEATRDGFSKISKILSSNGEDAFLYGKALSFADFIIVAHLLWMKAAFGVESPQWKDVTEWDEGRWMRLLKHTEKYQN